MNINNLYFLEKKKNKKKNVFHKGRIHYFIPNHINKNFIMNNVINIIVSYSLLNGKTKESGINEKANDVKRSGN